MTKVVDIACLVLLGAVIGVNCQDFPIYLPPVDCAYNSWSEFRLTSTPDLYIRTRNVIRQARNGGKPCTGPLEEFRNATDLQTPSLTKFLSMFIPGDRRTVTLGGRLLGRGQVPQTYTLTRDIALMIDTSLFESAFPLYKTLLSRLVDSACGDIGAQGLKNMFTLITYDSHQVQVIHSFNANQSKAAINSAILGIQAQTTDGPRAPSLVMEAMNEATTQLSEYGTGARPVHRAHKDAVLFVTYRSLCNVNSDQASKQLKIYARVYVVVLGDAGDGTQPPSDWCLGGFASDQFDFHFLWIKNYRDLEDFALWTRDFSCHKSVGSK